MKISRGSAYAIFALAYIEQHRGAKRVTVHEIAESGGIPEKHLAKIMQGLAKTPIVQSVRGINGGWFLGKLAADITLLDIVEALEGPIPVDECMLAFGPCDHRKSLAAAVCGGLQRQHGALRGNLDLLTIVDVVAAAGG